VLKLLSNFSVNFLYIFQGSLYNQAGKHKGIILKTCQPFFIQPFKASKFGTAFGCVIPAEQCLQR
jgi:hypothetical protein